MLTEKLEKPKLQIGYFFAYEMPGTFSRLAGTLMY